MGMHESPASPGGWRAVAIAACVAMAWSALIASATAQTKGTQQAPQPPRVIVVPNDIYRGPPAPGERYIAPPRSSQEISPSMPRPEPLPQMTPRVGN